MKYKSLLHFILFFSVFTTCKQEEPCPPQSLRVASNLIKKIYRIYEPCTHRIVHDALQYEVYMINCSESDKEYVAMSADWTSIWTWGPGNFSLVCDRISFDSNFPIAHTIPAHDTLIFHFMLYPVNEEALEKIDELKFGFIYFDAKKEPWNAEFNQWRDENNLAGTGFEKWYFASHRSAKEIEKWKKEHGFKTGPDPRTIWEN